MNISNGIQYAINDILYDAGTTVRIPFTNAQKDRYISIETAAGISYRRLTTTEQMEKNAILNVSENMTVKFHQYGFYIDDVCVMAGDTELQRIVLSDFLPEGYEKYYCFGYDTERGAQGCICATNDVWKIFHDRYVYTGYYQVQLQISEKESVYVINQETIYKGNPIPEGAHFPVCDSEFPEHILPSLQGTSVKAGTYYVKEGTKFIGREKSYEITENTTLSF